MSAIDLSSDLGLVACVVLTLQLLLGTLLAFRYNPWTHWPHRRFNYFRLHNWLAYTALVLVGAHVVVLLLIPRPAFRLVDVLFPVSSPQQPGVNTIGALALYAVLLVVTTSYFRLKMTRALWKAIHYVAYGVAAGFVVHGVLTDPTLTNKPVDWLDGEKILIEVCGVLLLVASAWRVLLARRRAALHRQAVIATARAREAP